MLTVGDLTGHGVTAASGMAMMLGALRGMAMAGIEPGPLMGWLNRLLENPYSFYARFGRVLPVRSRAPRTVLGTGRAPGSAAVPPRPGPLATAAGGRAAGGDPCGAAYGQAEERLEAGDVLVLHTDGLTPRGIEFGRSDGSERLLELAPRLSAARSARDCVRMVIEEFGEGEREDDACVLVARVGG